MPDLDRLFLSGVALGFGAALAWFGVAGLFAWANRERIRREIETREEARRLEVEAKAHAQIRADRDAETRQWPEWINP